MTSPRQRKKYAAFLKAKERQNDVVKVATPTAPVVPSAPLSPDLAAVAAAAAAAAALKAKENNKQKKSVVEKVAPKNALVELPETELSAKQDQVLQQEKTDVNKEEEKKD